MHRKSVRVIIAPYHVGIPKHRVGAGPEVLIARGLVRKLEDVGMDVSSSVLTYPQNDFEGDIGRSFAVIKCIADRVKCAIRVGQFPIILAGNCNATVGVAAALDPKDFGIVWFDAHADLDTPDEAVSGYFDGMGVSMLTGQSWRALMQTIPGHQPLSLHRIVYCGVRDLSDPQRVKLQRSPAKVVYGGNVGRSNFSSELSEQMNDVDFTEAIVHLDLDCLDTTIGKANEYAAPGGLLEADLQNCLDVVSWKVKPLALAVASFNPALEGASQIADVAVRAITRIVSAVLNPEHEPADPISQN
ncbi:hypothetical protein MMC16_002684 [Acarospora aff. strigata]|nr:hypothetical protein [Acarospora aff. strigata]